MAKTNLRILNPSRQKRRVGDIFAFQIKDGEFGFGRLISTSAKIGGFEDVHMIYIYKVISKDKSQIPSLSRDELLIPPLGTNQKPWTLGYFEKVKSFPLEPSDILPAHCFKDIRGLFFDENGIQIEEMIEPCGEFGLHSYRTIDDAISEAMGIEPAPHD